MHKIKPPKYRLFAISEEPTRLSNKHTLSKFRLTLRNSSSLGGGGGGGDFPMSGIQVCATDQGQYFTSKNPEQEPNFEPFFLNRP